ncbi:hypothetical protein STEG23_004670, partial [Scotinomys teguina]
YRHIKSKEVKEECAVDQDSDSSTTVKYKSQMWFDFDSSCFSPMVPWTFYFSARWSQWLVKRCTICAPMLTEGDRMLNPVLDTRLEAGRFDLHRK